MCGICGISGELQNNAEFLSLLLLDNEIRGKDATGYAYHHKSNNKVYYRKDALPATQFVTAYLWEKYNHLNADSIIGHTRAGTGGSAYNNNNNHPFITENYILVHNGILYNDDSLTKLYGLKRSAVTDSEVIPLMMEKLGVVEGLEAIKGSFAIAWIDLKKPSSLFLAKNDGSPIHVGYYGKSMVFSSSKEPLANIRCRDVESLDVGKIYEVSNGKVINTTNFTPKESWYGVTKYYDYGGWKGSRRHDGVYKMNKETGVFEYVYDDYSYDDYDSGVRDDGYYDYTNYKQLTIEREEFPVIRLAGRYCRYNPAVFTYEEVATSEIPDAMLEKMEDVEEAEAQYYDDMEKEFGGYDY